MTQFTIDFQAETNSQTALSGVLSPGSNSLNYSSDPTNPQLDGLNDFRLGEITSRLALGLNGNGGAV